MTRSTLLAVICLLVAGGAGYWFGLRIGNNRANVAIAEARQTAIEEVRKADSLLVQTLDSLVLYKESLDAAKLQTAISSADLKKVQKQGAGITVLNLPADSLVAEFQRIVNTPR